MLVLSTQLQETWTCTRKLNPQIKLTDNFTIQNRVKNVFAVTIYNKQVFVVLLLGL